MKTVVQFRNKCTKLLVFYIIFYLGNLLQNLNVLKKTNKMGVIVKKSPNARTTSI